MTTREKFVKLKNYIMDNYIVPDREYFPIGKMKFYIADEDFFAFHYFKVEVTVNRDGMEVELPDHIDFKDFNPVILLRDLWKEATDNAETETVVEVSLKDMAKALRVKPSNIKIVK